MRYFFVWLSLPTFFFTFFCPTFSARGQASTNAPSILTQPASVSVTSGASASFNVVASGAALLRYQWRVNNTNYVGATNATLLIATVRIFNAGAYQVVITNSFGAVTSQVATLSVDEHLTFRILELRTNSVLTTDHNGLTGDDRGGIAVSANNVFVTGDGPSGTPVTARYPIGTLAGGTSVGAGYDAIFGDLATDRVYNLGNGNTPISNATGLNFTTVNSLLEIDGNTGVLTGNRINLSAAISIDAGGNCGIFAGYGRLVLYNSSRVYNIALPSGVVTDLGTMPSPSHTFSESWCYWGVAEYFNGTIYLVYVQNSTTIVRRRVPTGATVTLASFLNLSDMASFTVSLSQGRWFFHHEGNSQFRSGAAEVLGSAKATYTLDAGYPLVVTNPVSQSVYIDFNATLRVSALGEDLSYQWLFNGVEIPGATDSVLLLTNVQPSQAGAYRVRVSNPLGEVMSVVANLTVITAPFIVGQPLSRSVFLGSNATFFVQGDGAPPLSYQWQYNGTNIARATNTSLVLTNIQLNQAGFYALIVSNRFGTSRSTNAELFVVVPVDDGSVFQITALQTNAGQTLETYTVFNNYEYGPFAASSNSLFFSTFNMTARVNIDPLGGAASIGRYYFALLSNLRTETAYALGDATAPFGTTTGTATTLWELNSTSGATTGNRITLSSPIPNVRQASQVGFFSGYDRAVILNGSRAYNIGLPSGIVTDLGPMITPQHAFSLGGSFWGVAEHFGGIIHLVYAKNSLSIVRTRVPDGVEFAPFPNFSNLSSYMASITVSIRRNRWYFHHLISSQFNPTNNATLGYAPASFNLNSGPNIDHFEWGPISALQSVNVPMTVTLTARNTANNIVSNFNGVVTLSGVNAANGAPLSIQPTSISGFVGGTWTGQVTVLQPSPGMYLRADNRNGSVGSSGIFSVSAINDLMIAMTDAPDPVVIGNPVTYTISLTNTGPNDATGVVLTNMLGTNVTFVSVAAPQGSCTNQGGVVRCDLGTVSPGNRLDVVVVVLPSGVGTVTNRAGFTRAETDADLSNNQATAITTVTLPFLTIADASVTEGDSETNFVDFVVSLAPPSTNAVTVNYSTANGTASSASDYVGQSGSLSFPPGTTNQTISIGVRGDILYEANETFSVNLSSPVNATLADNQAIGTILNDDTPPMVSVTDVTLNEGNSGTNNAVFRVYLSAPNGFATTINYATSNGTARAGSDFVNRAGTLNFAPGTTFLTQSVTIQVLGDTFSESNEFFYLNLTGVSNAVLVKAQGIGTILNDDAAMLDHFEWSAIPSPLQTNTPLAVSIAAKDVFGAVMTNFSGTVSLRGLIGQPGIDTNIIGNLPADVTEGGGGDFTIGFSFTPSSNLRVTHVRHYLGTKVSIWTDSGLLLASQAVSSTGGWAETPLAVPLQLQAGSTYRVAFYTGGEAYALTTNSYPTTFEHGSIGNNFYAVNDAFPDIVLLSTAFFLVDLRYSVGSPAVPVMIQPTMSGSFVNGVWTGNITVLERASGMHLEADDGAQHTGQSNPFDVMAGIPPEIVVQPADRSVNSGDNATFTVSATGAEPFGYQWRFNGQDIFDGTTATLALTNVNILNAGGYTVVVTNAFGSVTSRVATLTIDENLTFQIVELRTNGFIVLEHNPLTGDDRGGIAVSSNSVFYTGDESTARWGLETLNGGTRLNRVLDGLVSDLRTEKVYSLANGNELISNVGGLNFTLVTSLIELDAQTGVPTSTRIDLSAPVPIVSFATGIFAGYGRIIIFSGIEVYDIALPSGRVTFLGAANFFSHTGTENWAYWGIAEYNRGSIYLVYVQNFQTIARTRVPDGLTTEVGRFINLSDMAAITLSTSMSRWYFHHEFNSQFRNGEETIGSAKALFTTDPGFPFLVQLPLRQTNYPGSTVVFTVVAGGTPPLSYQWRFNGVRIEGAISDILVLPNVQVANAGNYSVEVSNPAGTLISPDAALVLITTPIIQTNPLSQISYGGSNVTFSVLADGAPPLLYQWRLNGANIPNATNATLFLTNLQPNQAGAYSARVSNTYGAVTSAVAQLTLRTRPLFLAQPQSQTAFGGSNVLFSVVADGAPPLFYQWRFNGGNITNATNSTLLLTNVQPADAGSYSVQVSNSFGVTNSINAILTVLTKPVIVRQPFDATVLTGTVVLLDVQVTGAPPLEFQWFFNGNIISNATQDTLVLTDIQLVHAGNYSVRVSNGYGMVMSSNAVLTVLTTLDDGSSFRIVNLLATGSRVVDHDALTGDDRGGVTASSTHVFVTGDGNTARFSLTDLSGGTVVGTTMLDTLVSNLRTETVYALGNGTNILTYGGGLATTLIELSNLGVPTGRRINLSTPVPAISQTGFDEVGIFSGYNRVVVHNAARVYNISLPSGVVVDLGAMNPLLHQNTESWAYWGVAENFGGNIYLVYVRDSQTIVRTRVPDGLTTNLATFSNLSDMGSFTVSIPRKRWYFHYEGSGQFGGTSETVGYANAVFKLVDHLEWGPIAPFQGVGVPFTVTLTARTEANQTATNFSGTVTLRGVNVSGGSTVSISPTGAVTFVNGVWTGQVTVLQSSPAMFLSADDGSGVTYNSGQFSANLAEDLFVWINDSPDPVLIGGTITYSIVVTNNGPSASTGVRLTNTFPSSLLFISAVATQGECTNAGGIVRCDLGTIPGGTAAEVTVKVAASAVGTMVSQVSVGRNEPDPSLLNNSATASTVVTYPSLFIQDAAISEGNSGTNDLTFTVVLSDPSTNTVTVNFITANGTATGSGIADYVSASGIVTFPPGSTNQPLVIGVRGDTMYELDETFLVNLSAPSNAVLGDAQGIGTILNDDPLPVVSVTDVTVTEGNSGTNNAVFRVSLSSQSGQAVTVNYSTANGTATAGSDYNPRSGVVNFAPATTFLTQTVTIQILGDVVNEFDETFFFNLISASNAVLGKAQGLGTILTDEGMGILGRFDWAPISSPQQTNVPLNVTITAKDFLGMTLTNFSGPVSLSGVSGQLQSSNVILGNVVHANTASGNWTLGYSFTPNRDLLVTHVRHYFGSKVSIWTDTGTLVTSVNVTSSPGTWRSTALTTPVTLTANTRYRVAAYTGGADYYWTQNGITNFAHGTIQDGYETGGDNFPGSSDGVRWWFVDLLYSIGSTRNVGITPTNSGNFVNGVWNGQITVLENATNVVLVAEDATHVRGESSPFDVLSLTESDLAITLSAVPNPASVGSNYVYTITAMNWGPAAAADVIVSNRLPAGVTLVSALASQGVWTNDMGWVIARLGTLSSRATANLWLSVRADVVGTYTNYVHLRCNQADPNPGNNSAQVAVIIYRDTDNDGIWDEWEQTHQLNANDPNDALLDPDGDRHNNWQEFRAGTDPFNAESVMRITRVNLSGNDVRIGFRGVRGKKYRLQRLEGGPPGQSQRWTDVMEFKVGSVINVELLDTGGANAPFRFYRVQVMP